MWWYVAFAKLCHARNGVCIEMIRKKKMLVFVSVVVAIKSHYYFFKVECAIHTGKSRLFCIALFRRGLKVITKHTPYLSMTPSDRPSSPWMGQFCTVRNLSDGPLHGEQHFCKNKKLVLLKTKLLPMESCRQLANLQKGER